VRVCIKLLTPSHRRNLSRATTWRCSVRLYIVDGELFHKAGNGGVKSLIMPL
jgi:hypothetical protein